MIKPPKNGKFKLDFDKRKKNNLIAPGLFLEILVTFECDEAIDQQDVIEIISENEKRVFLNIKAYISQPLIIFEPFISFGFVPINTKKTEYIKFENAGDQNAVIEFKMEKNSLLHLDKLTMNIPHKTKEYKKTLPLKEREKESTLAVTFELHFKKTVRKMRHSRKIRSYPNDGSKISRFHRNKR